MGGEVRDERNLFDKLRAVWARFCYIGVKNFPHWCSFIEREHLSSYLSTFPTKIDREPGSFSSVLPVCLLFLFCLYPQIYTSASKKKKITSQVKRLPPFCVGSLLHSLQVARILPDFGAPSLQERWREVVDWGFQTPAFLHCSRDERILVDERFQSRENSIVACWAVLLVCYIWEVLETSRRSCKSIYSPSTSSKQEGDGYGGCVMGTSVEDRAVVLVAPRRFVEADSVVFPHKCEGVVKYTWSRGWHVLSAVVYVINHWLKFLLSS